MKRSRRRLVRRAWLMRAAVMGAAVAFSAGAPAVGVPTTPIGAGVEAAGGHVWEQVIGMGKLRICWGACWRGWCCYYNPHF